MALANREIQGGALIPVVVVNPAGGVVPGVTATLPNLEKQEDNPHANGDYGIVFLAVRQDTATGLAGANGDYAVLEVDANGRLHVVGSQVEKAEDSAHVSGDFGHMALAVRQDTATALAAAGDYIPLIVNSSGQLYIMPPATELHLGESGFAMNVTAPVEITRTANITAYTANQRVGETGAVTAPKEITGMARVTGGSGEIMGIRLTTDVISKTPRIRVHFFNANNPTLAADNANYTELYADASKRVGYYDLPAMSSAAAGSDCSRSQDFDLRLAYKCAAGSTSLWFAYETLDIFTPTSGEKFSLVVKARLY